MNHKTYAQIRTVIKCVFSPRRFPMQNKEIAQLHDALIAHWASWQDALFEMNKSANLLTRILSTECLPRDERRLAESQLSRLSTIIMRESKR